MAYSERVRKEITSGHKIAAIKLLRQETGMGLKEAKDAVEDIERSLGIAPSTATNTGGFAGLVILAGLIVAGFLIYRYFSA